MEVCKNIPQYNFNSNGLKNVSMKIKNTKMVPHSAFGFCSSIISVVIPDSVTIIYTSAFYSCSELTSVVIPNSVTSIGN
jgi:hypothetical protein